MNKDRTTTTVYASSLKKNDVVILQGEELSVTNHPTFVGSKIQAEMVSGIIRNDAGNIVRSTHTTQEWDPDDKVTILVGGNPGAGL